MRRQQRILACVLLVLTGLCAGVTEGGQPSRWRRLFPRWQRPRAEATQVVREGAQTPPEAAPQLTEGGQPTPAKKLQDNCPGKLCRYFPYMQLDDAWFWYGEICAGQWVSVVTGPNLSPNAFCANGCGDCMTLPPGVPGYRNDEWKPNSHSHARHQDKKDEPVKKDSSPKKQQNDNGAGPDEPKFDQWALIELAAEKPGDDPKPIKAAIGKMTATPSKTLKDSRPKVEVQTFGAGVEIKAFPQGQTPITVKADQVTFYRDATPGKPTYCVYFWLGDVEYCVLTNTPLKPWKK